MIFDAAPTTRPKQSAEFADPSSPPDRKILVGLLLGSLLLFAFYYKRMFPGLTNADALDFAQIGRNLASGRGYVTSIVRPLALTAGASPQHIPDTTHGPLFPLLLALAFGGAGGAKDSVVSLVSGFFYLLTIPVVYVLGHRVFNRKVGLVTAAVFAINALNLEYAISGLHITLYTLLTALLFLNLDRLAERAYRESAAISLLPTKTLLLCGTLCGLLYLTDPIFLWFSPLILLSAAWLCPDFRTKALFWCALPLALLALPWMLRNQLVSGNALFGMRASEVWMGTTAYPGSSAYRMLPNEFIPSGGILNEVMRKIISGSNQIIQIFPQLSIGWLLLFFLPCLLERFRRESVAAVRSITLLCLGGLAFGTLLFSVQMPLFVSLVPPMLVFSVGYCLQLVGRSELTSPAKRLLNLFLLYLLLCPLYTDLFLTEVTPPLRSTAAAKSLSGSISPGSVLLSDQPWITAWYTDRPTIWLPNTDSRVADLRNRFPEIRFLFLTEQARSYSPTWQYIYDVLYRWTLVSAETRRSGERPPRPFVISGKGQPLLNALDGFTALAPDGSSPSVVIAALPDRLPVSPKRTSSPQKEAR